jgi:hypothetical protein
VIVLTVGSSVGVAHAWFVSSPWNTYWCEPGGYGYLGAAKYVEAGNVGNQQIASGFTDFKFTPSGAFPCSGYPTGVGANNVFATVELRMPTGAYTWILCKAGAASNPAGSYRAFASASTSYSNCPGPYYYGASTHSVNIYGSARPATYSTPTWVP